MYSRVLLAYDGSLEGRTALREGALMVRQLGARVSLLCVVAETPGLRMGEGAHAGAVAKARESYTDLFEEAMTRLRDLGFDAEGRLVSGEPAEEIAAYAREIGADLVVVGHRRQSFLERWWSGSTGAYLSDQLGCSLLVARNVITDEAFDAALARTR